MGSFDCSKSLGNTEDTESFDLFGESTGKTLSDLRDSVFPLLKSAEFQHSGFRKASESNGGVTQRRSDAGNSMQASPFLRDLCALGVSTPFRQGQFWETQRSPRTLRPLRANVQFWRYGLPRHYTMLPIERETRSVSEGMAGSLFAGFRPSLTRRVTTKTILQRAAKGGFKTVSWASSPCRPSLEIQVPWWLGTARMAVVRSYETASSPRPGGYSAYASNL